MVEDNAGEGLLKGAGLTRSERRSWKLHCQLAHHLTDSTLAQWQPTIERNLRQLRAGVTGQPHTRDLDRWESLVTRGDVPGLYRVLTQLDRESIEMREVSPLGGLLAEDERMQALRNAVPPKRWARRLGQIPQLVVSDEFDDPPPASETDVWEGNPPC